MNRRTTLYVAALVAIAGGAAAYQVASGADTDAAPAPAAHTARPTHHAAAHAKAPVTVIATPDADTVVVERETFGYTGGGRRDPFRSLMVTAALRPLPSELRLVAVAYDPTGINSVAILRDGTTHAQHRVGVGGRVGRMRVVRIRPRTVVFAVEELGFSRTEVVTLSDSASSKPQP